MQADCWLLKAVVGVSLGGTEILMLPLSEQYGGVGGVILREQGKAWGHWLKNGATSQNYLVIYRV